MSDKTQTELLILQAQVLRLEHTTRNLICWLSIELGEKSTQSLLDQLEVDIRCFK